MFAIVLNMSQNRADDKDSALTQAEFSLSEWLAEHELFKQ